MKRKLILVLISTVALFGLSANINDEECTKLHDHDTHAAGDVIVKAGAKNIIVGMYACTSCKTERRLAANQTVPKCDSCGNGEWIWVSASI